MGPTTVHTIHVEIVLQSHTDGDSAWGGGMLWVDEQKDGKVVEEMERDRDHIELMIIMHYPLLLNLS